MNFRCTTYYLLPLLRSHTFHRHFPPYSFILSLESKQFHRFCCCCCCGPFDRPPPKTLPCMPEGCSISCSWLPLFPLADTLFVFSSIPLTRTSAFWIARMDRCSSRELPLLLPIVRPTTWAAVSVVGGDEVIPRRGGEKHRGRYSSLSHANREFRKCSSRATRPCIVK